MKHTYNIIFMLCCLFFVPVVAGASEKTRYSALVNKVSRWSSRRVMQLASQYSRQGKDGEAIVLYSIVSDRYRDDMTEQEKHECILAHLKTDSIYFWRGSYSDALEEAVTGVKIGEQCNVPKYVARLYCDIGSIYGVFLDYEKSVNYYLKAEDLCRKYPDRATEHDILVNLTGMYTFLGKNAEARKYRRKAERLKTPGDPVDEFMSGYTLSLIQANEHKYVQAVERLKRLAVYARNKGIEPKYQCFAYAETYRIYDLMDLPDSTLKYIRLCDEAARKYNIEHVFAETLKDLAAFYEKEGDIATANVYKAKYLNMKDSVYDMREFDTVNNTLFMYEVNKTTKEIAELRMREEEKARTLRLQRITITAVGGGMLVLALLLAVVTRQKRKLNRSYADLYMVNANLVETQKRMADGHKKDRETIDEKEKRIAELAGELSKLRGEPEPAGEQTAKYRTSSLSDTQRQMLAEAIRSVMDNTEEFGSCDFTLDKLAQIVGSNSTYVSQVINDTFNKNFSSYVNTYRIRLACARLTDINTYGNLTMKAIGEGVGFKSYTTFVNVFREITGMTPALYRKMARQAMT